jgi:hypothetical protein
VVRIDEGAVQIEQQNGWVGLFEHAAHPLQKAAHHEREDEPDRPSCWLPRAGT